MKSVSRPPETSIKPILNKSKLIARILEISKKSFVKPEDATRFKFLLAHAEPSHRLNSRLMTVLRKHPEHAPSICAYIERYPLVPSRMAAEIVSYVCDGPELYHSALGAVMSASLGRMPGAAGEVLAKFSSARLVRPKRGSIPAQPTYKDALVAWSLSKRTLTYTEYEAMIFAEPDWWVQKRMLRQLDQSLFGSATYADLINRLLRVKNGEASRVAASRLIGESLRLTNPYGDVEATAKHTLKTAGVIKGARQPESRINQILAYILGRAENTYQWKSYFGPSHRQAELMTILLKKNFESNIDAFLVQLDSYCDLMTEKVWDRLKPGKKYPNYGHAVKDPTLNTSLPDTMTAFLALHDLRLQSATAHPRTTKTGMPTRRLKHKDFYTLRPSLIKAFDEFERVIRP